MFGIAWRRGLILGLALSIMLIGRLPGSGAGQHATAAQTSFITFELGDVPGTVCPGSSACSNRAAEPQIRAAPDGTFYASSEHGLGAGTDAWKSTDGGRHYKTLAPPNSLSTATSDPNAPNKVSPGGGDTDLAVAPVKNAAGFYNVYVASLTLAEVDVSTSTDGGATWKLNATSASIPLDDREWIAADGATKVCISYHDVVTFNIDVNCSFDAGTTFTQLGDAIDSSHAFLIDNNEIGNLAIDPNNHIVYQIFSGIANAAETACLTCNFHVVWIGVSTDGGKTFTDYPVFNNPNVSTSYGHQFANVSIDRAGNVYAVFSDNHNIYYSFSTNHGQTWSAPVQVNRSPSNTAIMPWSVAGDAGMLDIVWYGTSFFDGVTAPDSYPVTAAWFVYFAQNLQATTAGSGFSQVAATPIVHFGGVCEGGVSCTGNRDLFDDFGVAASPTTGLASIIYSDDQFINDANDPPSATCTAAKTNSRSCDHTSIATQTAGTGIFITKPGGNGR